jgi:1-acyl-sn-glycerol-3-phosphate acyltransferase
MPRDMPIIKPDFLRFALTWFAQRVFLLPLVWFTYQVLNRVKVEGLEHLDDLGDGPVILAPNHTSAWDSWVGCIYSLSSLKRFFSTRTYMCVWAAPENVPTIFLKGLTASLGAIPVDRERGVEQDAIQDTLRLMRGAAKHVVITVFPEGTRSKTGRLARKPKAGIGWLQHQTGATVVPIYHTGAPKMPNMDLPLTLKIGKPLRFEHLAGETSAPLTWRQISLDVMAELRKMEHEALGPAPNPGRPSRRTAKRAQAAKRS